jgi:aspartyl-tRNA(Asn)/glutamyl-tRNA(Gln) amidotransferase subunit A
MMTRRSFGAMLSAALVRADDTLALANISSVSDLLRRGKTSSEALVRVCLERIEKLNGRLNAFVTVTADRALADAGRLGAEARAGKWRGPLHGIPIALKDLYDTAGVRTTAGSRLWADRVPTEDAEVVRRLKAAGAIVLGKLNMDEFAYNFTGETSSFGTSRNPWNPDRSPGGSSGGSAVAVATGMCFGALGSDTGGSIRLPAALCGITGYKPTYGIVSAEGVAPLAWSLDHVGPMCRSADDAALMMHVLTGRPVRYEAVNVRALRLGIPRGIYYEGIDKQVAEAVSAATEALARMTTGARDITMPPLAASADLPDLPEAYIRVISAEAHAFHEEMLRLHPDRYHPGTRASLERGAAVTAATYIHARRELDRLRAASERFFAGTDILITPTAPGPAFAFGERRLVWLRNTAPWNLLGLPSISIPCGFSDGGLPLGLQITGRAGRDDAVLALAAAYQKATSWHTKRPPLPAPSA